MPRRTPATSTRPAPKTRPSARKTRPDADAMDDAVRQLQEVTSRLRECSESLAQSLGEVPKAADFEPLADHLYELARTAPRLIEAVEELPKVATPIERSVRALHEVSDTLTATTESFSESLLRLPRLEDYEPLATPLREFARVSPALAESLREVLKVAGPLAGSVRELRELGDALRETHARMSASAAVPAAPVASKLETAMTDARLRDAAAIMNAAHRAIEHALATLPQDPDYAPLAAQLRELATVSPSLMDWLKHVEGVTAPLTASVKVLREAAAALEAGEEALLAGDTAKADSPKRRKRDAL